MKYRKIKHFIYVFGWDEEKILLLDFMKCRILNYDLATFIYYPASFVCECQAPPQTGFNAHHTFETLARF
jgi:hypothetical protein